MPGCSAYGCSNRTEDGFCLKVFPRDPARRAIWAAMVNRKNWIPKDTSYLCEKHFEDSQWEVARVDGKKKLKTNAIPTIFDAPVKRKGKTFTGKRRKQLKNGDEDVIKYMEHLEVLKHTPKCVVCSRPLVDDRKEILSTLTSITGLSLHQYIMGLFDYQPSPLNKCTPSDLMCFYCAHLINYADKIEADLIKLKAAIKGCIQITSLNEDEQELLKTDFKSQIEVLDAFSDKVVGPGSAASRKVILSKNPDNEAAEIVMREATTALGSPESSQAEGNEGNDTCENKVQKKSKGCQVQTPQTTAPPEPPTVASTVFTCKICQLKTTSRSVLTFHLRRHMANYQWCDFCDTPIFEDENEIVEMHKHSAALF